MFYNQEEKHQAVQNLDQCGKFAENPMRNTEPTDRSSSRILVGKQACNNIKTQRRLRPGTHSKCDLLRVTSEITLSDTSQCLQVTAELEKASHWQFYYQEQEPTNTPILGKRHLLKTKKGGLGIQVSSGECQPSRWEALGLNPSTTETKPEQSQGRS